MTVLHKIRIAARHVGLDINRYNPLTSQSARIVSLLQHHKIDLVLDVGANDGGYGKELRQSGFKGSILSFEPLQDPYERLKITALAYSDWHVAPRMALGSQEGEMEINVSANSTSSSILPMEKIHCDAAPSSKYMAKQKISVQRLDKFEHILFKKGTNKFLKIDTQGYERSVIEGASGFLHDLKGIQVEMSLVSLYKGQALYEEIIEILKLSGFELWNIVPGFSDSMSGRLLQMDGIFFRSSEIN